MFSLPPLNLEVRVGIKEQPPRKFTRQNQWVHKDFSSKNLNANRKSVNASLVHGSSNITVPKHSNLIGSKVGDREHVQVFENVFRLFSTYAKLVGIEVSYYWIPHRCVGFFLVNLLMSFTWLCVFYTQFIHIKNGEILKFLEPCAIYGVSSSCTQKLMGYLKKRHHIVSIFLCVRKICRGTECGSHGDILTLNLLRTLRFSKLFAVGVIFCVGLFVACPFKSYVFDKELVSLIPIEIIFVDQSTVFGFVIANIVMTVMGVFAALGTILYGASFIFAISMYALHVELIGQDFDDLDSMWEKDSTVSLSHRHTLLRNICEKVQDIINYMNTVKHIFESKFFYYFCFNYMSQIICLFEIAKNQWLPGYGIALALFIEMMFYCVMGSQITIANERLASIICNSNWYNYDIKYQRKLILLLHRSQQLGELALGPLGPLTVVTGIEVIKSIYSYYTILTEVL